MGLSSSLSRSTLVLSLCGLEVWESPTSFFGIPVTASSSFPSRAAVMLLDAVSGLALMLSASPGTASLEVRG